MDKREQKIFTSKEIIDNDGREISKNEFIEVSDNCFLHLSEIRNVVLNLNDEIAITLKNDLKIYVNIDDEKDRYFNYQIIKDFKRMFNDNEIVKYFDEYNSFIKKWNNKYLIR